MNSHRCCTRQLLVLLLIISSIVTTFALAADDSEKAGVLQFTAHPDGTFSVISQSAPLEMLLSRIRETTNVDIYIDGASKKRPVSINVKNISLIQLLRRIAGANYAMVYDGLTVSALHVLPKGKTQSANGDIAISEFSGQVKITNQRARMFFTPANKSKSAIDSYINKRHEALSKLSEENPNKELHAQISFKGYLSADQVIALVNENQLDPVTLNIGWKENGGGYDLKQGEAIELAIKSAAAHHERFIAELQEDANMQVTNLRQQGISDVQMQSELAFQQNANDMNSVFHSKGVPFYGVRVAATAKQLQALTSNDRKIRLVDPLWGGSVEDEIANVYPTTKIAIPLVPDNETFIPEITEDRK
ncbi:MAG: hypothetical protein CO150_02890 [Nitrospirae bacterium CG_4_9_14_3_um_filter_53_35]|nr:MAG: hypothetical protein AUK29_02330 [Nitrospirae bacterium CG2_30_53_67]PIS38032.1 MAG: hypothetical protein COT35_02945 [Nitrospirae bacterium CG08_land_8_20_14_0_20_52_24]PIW84926.1 MAG: hypothetical protein COZ95_07260 [Nitrospirae bacterium CG_4_8_14_3_um_filter_50_41]PIX86122.1 MAG: hypothetical protein COZ32_04945 [Nitrospirae bacterium CG_4_10_14_3_um_filter_53_41]PJA76609.1 MAG: hypothetical protein CO150_02890 [Nitrospirae bacterium CG_4_9_14_3_um_filter_53_35]